LIPSSELNPKLGDQQSGCENKTAPQLAASFV
jgi:hypothetical protein